MAKLHLIGNGHLDPVWLWRWQEGFAEIRATFRSALDRLKEFPDLKFTSACAVYYQWIEKIDPDMFEEIRERVREGRWNIAGGWFLQPDCNIPCGESFARHGLIAQRYFLEKFGVMAKTGYNVDSFGHNASLPQILKKSGMENYVFMRPQNHEKEMKEDLFLWESPDGSRVTAYRIPVVYNVGNWGKLELIPQYREKAERDNQDYMIFFGIGNHGGGPTIKLIQEIDGMGVEGAVYSTPDEYFAGIRREGLPVVTDELQHHARGCYSASAFVKMQNRKCENALLEAESFCVMAKRLTGLKYPGEKLQKAWKNLLFNQFHDICGGCCVKGAYEDAGYLFGETMSIAEQAVNLALQSIARRIDTLQGETLPSAKNPEHNTIWEHEALGTPVIVFNPHTWSVRMPVQINAVASRMTDETGEEIPFQIVRGDQTDWDSRFHTVFLAEVEPFGYRVYRLFTKREGRADFDGKLTAGPQLLENSRIRAEFDSVTGELCGLYDKKAGEYLIRNACRAVLLDETAADTWAHDKVYLGEEAGMFREPVFSVTETGPVRATLRVTTKYGRSSLRREYTIFADSDRIRVKTIVDFREQHKTLKLAFPIEAEEVTAKIPYGTIRRKVGLGEEPCGSWIAAGRLGIANDGKYGYDTTPAAGDEGPREMRLTVLRSALYADHYGRRDEFCEYMEQGIHEFNYLIFPFRTNTDAERRARELNTGLRGLMESFHGGSLARRQGCFSCDADGIVVTAVKQAEEKNSDVIRLCEMEGRGEKVSLRIFDRTLEAEVACHEIKTLFTDGRETDLIESR
ncbi:MAG: alpha-mannosidase [Roseburia sp.]|nr:alpha-mannosidase [Roseburia sp.]MCM1096448.1 alpha-mannosidase [Ruminococcus flavefaciens]